MKKTEKKQGGFRAPKGMQDLMGKDFYNYQGLCEKASEIAEDYGFKPISTPILEETGVFTSGVGTGTDIVEKEMYSLKTKSGTQLSMRPEGTAPIMRAYIEHGMQTLPQPVMLYYYGNFYRHERPQKGRLREFRQFGLETLGSDKSIGDAIIIKIAMTILEEAGIKNLSLHINSIGDRFCRNTYKKDLVNYYKKNSGEICRDCAKRIKTNPLRVLDCKDPKCQEIKAGAPQSVSYLCDACKQHFKEVLEYLESLGIEYKINHNLVRGLDYYTRTVFEFITKVPSEENGSGQNDPTKEGEKKEPEMIEIALGGGGRYNQLARALGNKKDIPAAGVGLGLDRIIMCKDFKPIMPRSLKKPKFYFIQLGFEAKLQSLRIIEILRKARIGVMHSLNKDSLSAQLATVEKLKIPYAIILGQKEVIEKTVIIRNMEDRSQDEVKVEDLGKYIKKLK